MEMDRRLLGEGPYPLTGRWAVLARLGFLGALATIAVAVVLPGNVGPPFVGSYHLQHFAAFYVATLLGLAASPRLRVRRVALRIVLFTTVVEGLRLIGGAAPRSLIDNWAADVGGMAAAIAPLGVARWRRRFAEPPADS
jgi:hypothetical protein